MTQVVRLCNAPGCGNVYEPCDSGVPDRLAVLCPECRAKLPDERVHVVIKHGEQEDGGEAEAIGDAYAAQYE